MSQQEGTLLYVGTYTQVMPHVQGSAEGVYSYRMDPATGALRRVGVAPGVVNPSFVALGAGGARLYAVQEVGLFGGQRGGGAAAFAADPATGALTPLGPHQPTHGADPCHALVDRTGRWLLVANYSGGCLTVLPIDADGALGPATDVVHHDGPHPHHDGPHPHSTAQAPGGHILAPDCGLDRVYVYTLDEERGTLVAAAQPWLQLAPGAGPRHLAFHPRGDILYAINERDRTMSVIGYDAASGALRELQTLSTLPEGAPARGSTADVHVHPSGRFVYGSNRGHDSIAAFAADEQTGLLTPVGHTSTGGRTPRGFNVDPSGTFLLAANQDSHTVVTLRIDPATGALHETGMVAEVPSPVCLAWG